MSDPAFPIPLLTRAVEARVHQMRAHPMLNPVALAEVWRERAGHPVDPAHRPHLLASLEWLARAQDATGDGGFARGYSVAWNPYFHNPALEPRLDRINAPTLVLWGGEDQLIPRAHAERYRDRIAGAALRMLPQCGHLPVLEQPVTFADSVVDFLGRHPLRAAAV